MITLCVDLFLKHPAAHRMVGVTELLPVVLCDAEHPSAKAR